MQSTKKSIIQLPKNSNLKKTNKNVSIFSIHRFPFRDVKQIKFVHAEGNIAKYYNSQYKQQKMVRCDFMEFVVLRF